MQACNFPYNGYHGLTSPNILSVNVLDYSILDFTLFEDNFCTGITSLSQYLKYVALESSLAIIPVFVFVFVSVFVLTFEYLVIPTEEFTLSFLVLEATVNIFHRLSMLKQVSSLIV